MGVGSDAADVPKQCAVTPVVGYLGELDVETMTSTSALEKGSTLMAVRLDDLLSKESVDVSLVPGVGPMPVFNAGFDSDEDVTGEGAAGPGGTHRRGGLKIWGLYAQILHQVMRVVVGPRKEYMEALYGPFVNKKFAGGAAPRRKIRNDGLPDCTQLTTKSTLAGRIHLFLRRGHSPRQRAALFCKCNFLFISRRAYRRL